MKSTTCRINRITMAAAVAVMALLASGCGAAKEKEAEIVRPESEATEIAPHEEPASEEASKALVAVQTWKVTPKAEGGTPISGSRTYSYDDEGLLQQMESASNGRSVVYHYEYDAAGNMVHEYTEAYDHVMTYDGDNHLLTDVQTNTMEDGSQTVLHRSYTYYETGKVATYVTDESGSEVTWKYGYNEDYYAIQKPETIEYYDYEDRLIADSVLNENREEIPKGLYAYDEQGNLSGYENAGGTHMDCENTYDGQNRLTVSLRTITFSDGSEGTYQEYYEYAYDDQGRMTAMLYYKLPQNGEKTLVEGYTWEYNDAGDLLRETHETETYTMENLYTYA